MEILIKIARQFKINATYIFSIENKIETIVEYKGVTETGERRFICNDLFSEKMENLKIKPSENKIFIMKSNNDKKSIVTIPFEKINIVFPDE
jgi:hypothetical protein